MTSVDSSPWSSPEIEEINCHGGRHYKAYQVRKTSIGDDRLDQQTKRFYELVQESHQKTYPENYSQANKKKNPHNPSCCSGIVHRRRELFLASSENVQRDVGLGIGVSGENQLYKQSLGRTNFTRHNYNNKCAEWGATRLVQEKYGNDVNMRGDRISTYGFIQDEEGQGKFLGFHPGCQSGRPSNRKGMGCEDVLAENGITDIHRRTRAEGSDSV